MSPWLLDIFFDIVVRQVNKRAIGRRVKLRDDNGGGWEIKQVLYRDNTVMVAEIKEHLQNTVTKFEGRVKIWG